MHFKKRIKLNYFACRTQFCTPGFYLRCLYIRRANLAREGMGAYTRIFGLRDAWAVAARQDGSRRKWFFCVTSACGRQAEHSRPSSDRRLRATSGRNCALHKLLHFCFVVDALCSYCVAPISILPRLPLCCVRIGCLPLTAWNFPRVIKSAVLRLIGTSKLQAT